MSVRIHHCALLILWTAAALAAGCGRQAAATVADPSTENHARADLHSAPPAVPAASAKTETPPTAPNEVVIDNFRFQPRQLKVAPGTRVTWVNRDDVPHTATSTQKPRTFDSGPLDTDNRFSYVFTKAGTYEYFCAVHPHMTGQITVK
jgi:plastocyanin